MAKNSPAGEVKRVGKFGIVGVINTVIDLGLYNILSGTSVGLSLIGANIISTTVAMIFSFFANQRYVFEAEGKSIWRQAIVFFPVTAIGLYVIQNGVIYFLTKSWTGPLDLGISIAHAIGVSHFLSDGFLFKNGAKAAATILSLCWNYIMYKKVVFRR
ncbi:MAG TPA: GtrA family protein [Candidatus Nanoarchaeia archaeon]|nr:GtrA family protein [Candidatus Nanoarchaeia archaeon]